MKAIMVMFDSLSKNYLPCYGNDWVKAPQFERLARESVTFDKCFVGSMPCMPARRELHTGRYNFLHRSWGPLEPFDDSMPELLKKNSIYTHLVSDHFHYWEDGGATYHNRYSSWENVRGQEGDYWKADIETWCNSDEKDSKKRQDLINRRYLRGEENATQTKTFDLGEEFIRENHDQDDWFLQIECFDPHPPFFSPQEYRDLYGLEEESQEQDWPPYSAVDDKRDTPEKIDARRREYAALISMCDHSLGRVLNLMDEYGLWEDTMLIVTTDHGFLLGEHGWWAFCRPPFYDQVSVKPLFVWDPRSGRKGRRNAHIAQTHDIPATLLEYFGVERPSDMMGKPLRDCVAVNQPVREACLFGLFGGHVNCSDGRYVYMRAPVSDSNTPLYEYTLMPTHMMCFFNRHELENAVMSQPFSFTKGMPVLRCPGTPFMNSHYQFGNLLFDLENDPNQEHPITDPVLEKRMMCLLIEQMRENDAPIELYERLGLSIE